MTTANLIMIKKWVEELDAEKKDCIIGLFNVVEFDRNEKTQQLNEIKTFCVQNKEYFWAAKVWGIITGRDFREIV